MNSGPFIDGGQWLSLNLRHFFKKKEEADFKIQNHSAVYFVSVEPFQQQPVLDVATLICPLQLPCTFQ